MRIGNPVENARDWFLVFALVIAIVAIFLFVLPGH